MEFGFLRANLELTAGNLSQHLGVLENAGLITIEKGYEGKRARTWITLTKAGQAALAEEIAQLRRLISQVDRANSAGLTWLCMLGLVRADGAPESRALGAVTPEHWLLPWRFTK